MQKFFNEQTLAKAVGRSQRTLRNWRQNYGLKFAKIDGCIQYLDQWVIDFFERYAVGNEPGLSDTSKKILRKLDGQNKEI